MHSIIQGHLRENGEIGAGAKGKGRWEETGTN